jgi:hypothetical protein
VPYNDNEYFQMGWPFSISIDPHFRAGAELNRARTLTEAPVNLHKLSAKYTCTSIDASDLHSNRSKQLFE